MQIYEVLLFLAYRPRKRTTLANSIDPCAALPPASSPDFQSLLQAFLDNGCYVKQNWRNDPQIRGTNGVHPNVKVW